MCGLVHNFCITCKKDSVKANCIKKKKKKNIVFGLAKASELAGFPGVNTPLKSCLTVPGEKVLYQTIFTFPHYS